MNIDFLKDKFEEFQAVLIDKMAKSTVRWNLSFKQKLALLVSKIAVALPFCRYEYTVKTMMERLKISKCEAEKHTDNFFRNFLLNAFEMASLRYISDEELQNKVQVEGIENLSEAMGRGKGGIIISGHFGPWEFIPQWLTMNGFPMTTVVRRQNNKYVDEWFNEMRTCHGANITDCGFAIREILRELRRGGILALMSDQDNGKAGVFVKFFDKYASAPIGPAIISLKTRAPIIPLAIFPNYEGKHLIKISKPIYPDNYENTPLGQQQLTQEYTNYLESIIREYPDQWFWVHRRWKTQPQDAPDNPYAKLALENI